VWDVVSDRRVVSTEIEHFADHLKSIYEMEMFYGDETLQGLLDHTKHLRERMSVHAALFSDKNEGDTDDSEANETNEEGEEGTDFGSATETEASP
jgi:hypothetical protein